MLQGRILPHCEETEHSSFPQLSSKHGKNSWQCLTSGSTRKSETVFWWCGKKGQSLMFIYLPHSGFVKIITHPCNLLGICWIICKQNIWNHYFCWRNGLREGSCLQQNLWNPMTNRNSITFGSYLSENVLTLFVSFKSCNEVISLLFSILSIFQQQTNCPVIGRPKDDIHAHMFTICMAYDLPVRKYVQLIISTELLLIGCIFFSTRKENPEQKQNYFFFNFVGLSPTPWLKESSKWNSYTDLSQ